VSKRLALSLGPVARLDQDRESGGAGGHARGGGLAEFDWSRNEQNRIMLVVLRPDHIAGQGFSSRNMDSEIGAAA
jgi:hypothetical protein